MNAEEKTNVLVGIPCNFATIFRKFTQSLIALLKYSRADEAWADSAYLWDMRNLLAKILVDHKQYQYLFMVDADMAFPHDLIDVALRHAQQFNWDIVGVPYLHRDEPKYHLYIETGHYRWQAIHDLEQPKEIDAVGTGLILIHREVFEKMEWPWFKGYWRKGIVSEDLVFCNHAKRAGFKIGHTHVVAGVQHLAVR
jgi:hypothetical protein